MLVKPTLRRAVVSCLSMVMSMGVSLVGLDKIIKYGYGYCGYLGIAIIIVPFLTVGVYKNRKYLKEHPEYVGQSAKEAKQQIAPAPAAQPAFAED